MSTYEKLSLFLEVIVVIILIGEFVYDAWWNNREQRHKRRAKRKNVSFDSLTKGEMR